jgi:hypothetical protein
LLVIYRRPLGYLLGAEGAALLRAFAGHYDREFTGPGLTLRPSLVEGGILDAPLSGQSKLPPYC